MGLEHFNKACRPYIFRQLSSQEFDILIIGGGITGASIFRDAVLRGLRTALIEAQDFASGTSSRSSKLVHGGLRYLRHLHFNLVRESCRERNLHLKLNGRLVQPVRFLMPVYRNGSSSPTKMRVAMWLYDAMSGFKSPRPHQFINREDVLAMAPGITSDGLSGGCLYYEAIVSDGRLTLETVKDGVRHGGTAINHAPVVGLIKFDGQISGVKCRDKLTGRSHSIRANVVVNATGVFADRLRRLDGSDVPDLLTLSKGTHLVFAESDIPIKESIVFFSHIDGRALFLIKHEGCFLYGTTDDWEDANPAFPTPSTEDVDYLLESLRRFMPGSNLNPNRIQYAYSGFRPLVNTKSHRLHPSDASREDFMEIASSGLITVVGGKLTTARSMAARVLNQIVSRFGNRRIWPPCRTDKLPIGGTNEEVQEGVDYWGSECPPLAGYFKTLFRRYGIDAHAICAEAKKICLGQDPHPIADPQIAEVRYVCRHEMTCMLEDLAERRVGFLHWNPDKRLERLRYVADLVREELGLSLQSFEEQYGEYEHLLRRLYSVPGHWART